MSDATNGSEQMSEYQVQRVTVIGAGTMGHGIAAQAARCGYSAHLYDPQGDALERGLAQIDASYQKAVDRGKMNEAQRQEARARLSASSAELSLALDGADLVIEAVPERLELKRHIFQSVEQLVGPAVLLASNTSSLSISAISEGLAHPERLLGMHFFNPVMIMPLLELVRGDKTSEAALEAAKELGAQLSKTCIVVKDSPGFATSRLGITLGNEAMRMFEEGVASAEDIDRAMTLGYRHPIGPLALTDLVGLDVRLSITEHLYRELGTDTFKPPQILIEKVARGELGKKSGRGFYIY